VAGLSRAGGTVTGQADRYGPTAGARRVRGGPAGGPPLTFGLVVTLAGVWRLLRRCPGWDGVFGGWLGDDAHGPPAPHAAERDEAADQREQGVITAAADSGPGVEVGAALADQDLARVDPLAAEPLHAQPLSRGVAPVAAGRRALLVCHRQLFFPAAAPAFGVALLFAALFSGLAFSEAGLVALDFPLPAEMPVILTWVYRWRCPSRRR